jgi:hypothetical protein
MSIGAGSGRQAFPSSVDPAYDCIPIGSQTPNGRIAAPPSGDEREAKPLCPEGYVPQLRHKKYSLKGKTVVADAEPEPNPTAKEHGK